LALMNVLYLSYDGLTDGLGRSQVLPYLFGLAELGHSFTIISFEKEVAFKSDQSAIRLMLDAKNIKWFPITYTPSPPVLSTVYDVFRLQKLALKLHRKNPFDIIHCRSYITSLVGLALKKKHGIKFVFDMRAFYADERVDGGLWNLNNPIFKLVYKYFKKKELDFLENADYTISLTEKGKNIIHGWSSIKGQPIPIKVIPCCADLAHFHPNQIKPELQTGLIQKLGLLETDLVITYLGSIGTWYMLDEMLDFFKALLEKKPNAKFLFVTTDNADGILTAARKRGINESRLAISPAKREEVPTYLSLAHLALFFIKPVFSKSGSSPTKHGEMLGMGLPVIANTGVGDVDEIIEATNSGVLVNEFTNQAYQKAINQIDDLLKTPISVLQSAASAYYSLETGVKRYNEVYASVMGLSDDTSRS
ncbi:glycosyltransferase, partial [Bacteroidota bacterium]